MIYDAYERQVRAPYVKTRKPLCTHTPPQPILLFIIGRHSAKADLHSLLTVHPLYNSVIFYRTAPVSCWDGALEQPPKDAQAAATVPKGFTGFTFKARSSSGSIRLRSWPMAERDRQRDSALGGRIIALWMQAGVQLRVLCGYIQLPRLLPSRRGEHERGGKHLRLNT